MSLQTPNPQLFLNELDDEQVEQFKAVVYASGDFRYLVNHRHIYGSIDIAELETMKSIRPQDGIDKDLVSTVHGTTEYAKQLIRHHILYRDAIIQNKKPNYPLVLFTVNQPLLNIKQSKYRYRNDVDGCSLPNPVSKELYDLSYNGIASCVQAHFKDPLTYYHSLIISGVLIKTTMTSYGKLFNDSCISFYFDNEKIRYGLVRAIVKSKQDSIRLFIEELVEKKPGSSHLKFKVNDEQYQLPNVFLLKRSTIFHIKHPKCLVKKHAIIYKPGNHVPVLEYPNLRDNS
ncbi:unnamed protein product [Rotaria sp. Silwood2]|nr:unnamed protein product [Rotaria sp. Silwood2]